MTATPDSSALLGRALDQTERLLARATPDRYDDPTPCERWRVGDLVRHVVASPANFVTMLGGGEVEWDNPPPLGPDPAADFRAGAEELLAHDRESGGKAADVALPEFAVHSWDLARALGVDEPLDDEVAERGLGFMTENLTAENRAPAFGPEREAPDGASVHDRIAAFAGRSPMR